MGLNLVSLAGLLVMIGLAWLMSSHRDRVPWKMVGIGVLLQVAVAAALFQSQSWTFDGRFPNGILFFAVDELFGLILEWARHGAEFVFGINGLPDEEQSRALYLLQTFAFGVLPTVIFFGALMSVLYHLNIMQRVVQAMAWVMRRTMGTSGAESLAAAANVFVGHTEAPLVVRPFLAGMTRSELNAVMIGGFATITGGLMAVFAGMGISAGHLVAASIISAPAALVIAKILLPEMSRPATADESLPLPKSTASNVIEAAAVGAGDGMRLAINIIAMLIAFLALIAMIDALLRGLGELVQGALIGLGSSKDLDLQWSLSGLFGILFWPVAWIMGIAGSECAAAGNLLGTKMVLNEFIAYEQLGSLLGTEAKARAISPRSEVILTYALCGFSNFGAIAIQIGGIGALAPERQRDLAQLGLRAMLGGTLACNMTACVAGILYGLI